MLRSPPFILAKPDRPGEDKFIGDGYGIDRRDVTHNALTAPFPTGSFDLNGNVTFVLDVTFPARAAF
jgi:hypothetical protein